MDARFAEFRAQVEEHFGGRPGRGARYPEALRATAVELAADALNQGEALRSVAQCLGLGSPTLSRWLEGPAPERRELRPVELVEEPRELLDRRLARQRGDLLLVTAAGHRVEGLEVGDLLRLLQVLG